MTTRTRTRSTAKTRTKTTERPRVCFDMMHTGELASLAMELAALESARNETPQSQVFRTVSAGIRSPDQLAIVTNKKWAVGRTLRVRFLSGRSSLHDRIVASVQEISKHANLRFVKSTDSDAEIRVDFVSNGGAWSYIGTDCLAQPKTQPTMNLGWVTETDYDEGTVLHEFGHAIGAIHEHQTPAGGINWNKPAVYRDLGGPPNNWDRQTIDHNMFSKYAADQTQYTAVDRLSIMMYHIPATWTLDGWSAPWNRKLSDTDKSWLKTVYPGAAGPGTDETGKEEINRLVIENLKRVFASPPPSGIVFHFISGIADFNNDRYADVSAIIGMQVGTGARRKVHVYQVLFDGLSPHGGTIGLPKVIAIL